MIPIVSKLSLRKLFSEQKLKRQAEKESCKRSDIRESTKSPKQTHAETFSETSTLSNQQNDNSYQEFKSRQKKTRGYACQQKKSCHMELSSL